MSIGRWKVIKVQGEDNHTGYPYYIEARFYPWFILAPKYYEFVAYTTIDYLSVFSATTGHEVDIPKVKRAVRAFIADKHARLRAKRIQQNLKKHYEGEV